MKLVAILVLFGVACVLGALALPGDGKVLAEKEAGTTMGGSCWGPSPKFKCAAIGNCDALNQVTNCPSETGYCSFCTNGGSVIHNCVQDVGGDKCSDDTDIDCGLFREGICYDATCNWVVTSGECLDGPDCLDGCP